MKLFVVLKCDYDYTEAVAIFTEKSVAEEYVHAHEGHNWFEISEPPIDPDFPRFDKDLKIYCVKVTRHGEVLSCEEENDILLLEMEEKEKTLTLLKSTLPYGLHYMMTYVSAKSEGEATEIAKQRQQLLVSSDRWPTDYERSSKDVVL